MSIPVHSVLHVSVNKSTLIQKERSQCTKSVRCCLRVYAFQSSVCMRDMCAICTGCDVTLCNPCHLLHPGKPFPPTRLSVGSSHSRLPYSSSPSMNRPWDKPPTVQNVFLSYVLAGLIIMVCAWSLCVCILGRVWKEVNSWLIWLYREHRVCHSVLF